MTNQETEKLAEEFIQSRPNGLIKEVNATNAGIGLMLKLLRNSESGSMTAGEISDAMNVSTARVAVLLKKMEKSGLIAKKAYEEDARITVVYLLDEGRKRANAMKRIILDRIAKVIEKMGEDKFRQFIALSVELQNALGDDFPPEPNRNG